MKKINQRINCENKLLSMAMKLIFWLALTALIFHLIIPKSIFYFRKSIYNPILGGLNQYDLVLTVDESYHLYVYGINKRVSFQSTDIKVATVNLIGTVRAWRPGTTIIRVKYDKKVLKCRVRVVKLNPKSMKLKIGEKKSLSVKNAFIGVKYRSSNSKVVTVSRYGRVKAIAKGTATITATYKGKKLICKVSVD